ncbi:O-antigen polysaccharide polymerase Wzy [Aliiglaciecola sp. 3_MG-2023]|uniref:O-antigen polysaccharide polymerase Wzy n=1 Tax=Aliiglaciecola sp. 3_MG-2023 TaxID=3062644 RepID=UPI0026E3D54A|nr:O-antigen polysaccharide polymerase Wzy [Aliiglaciecola sp. 3_MG-2023]MDO6693225.1 O-antigen polysaccharide polymerase Wzy [Aliiglaciecola sp. 3_MG-2023]
MVILLILLTVNFVTFYFVGYGVSEYIVYSSSIMFGLLFIAFAKNRFTVFKAIDTKINVLVLFTIFYFILFYLPYLTYSFGLSDIYYSPFFSHTFVEHSNKAIILSNIGYLSFLIGREILPNKSADLSPENQRDYSFFVTSVIYIFFSLILINLLATLPKMIQGAYSGSDVGSSTENGLYFLLNHFSLLVAAIFIAKKALGQKISKLLMISILVVLFWCLVLLVLGDRNTFFIHGIVLLGGYFTFCRRISYVGLAATVFVGIALYGVIEQSRKLEERSFSSIASSISDSEDNKSSFFEGSLNNTTISLRASISYLEKTDESFQGKFKAIGLLGVIPLVRGMIVDPNDPFTNSAEVNTTEILGANATWSVGTNIVSDSYLDFGVYGVVILLFIVGLFTKFVENGVRQNHGDLQYIVIYLFSLALISELPRYAFSFPIRNLVWLFLLFFIYKKFFKVTRK